MIRLKVLIRGIIKIVFFNILISCSNSSLINIDKKNHYKIYFLTENEVLNVFSEKKKSLNIIYPVKTKYSNINMHNEIEPQKIKYRTRKIRFENNKIKLSSRNKLGLGTYYITSNILPPIFSKTEPLHCQNGIIQIVIRRDNSLHGYLMELINTPYIFTPIKNLNEINQVDNRLGSDCASFITYGLRRSGLNIPYVSPQMFLSFLKKTDDQVYIVKEKSNGIYLNSDNEPFRLNNKFIKDGIILNFGKHVSLLYEDKGVKGILDSEDLVIQSWFDGPSIVKISENGFFNNPIEIFSH